MPPEEFIAMEPQAIIKLLKTKTSDLEGYISESAATEISGSESRLARSVTCISESDNLTRKRMLLFSGSNVSLTKGGLVKRLTENKHCMEKTG
jgi:hypothetical protein